MFPGRNKREDVAVAVIFYAQPGEDQALVFTHFEICTTYDSICFFRKVGKEQYAPNYEISDFYKSYEYIEYDNVEISHMKND